MKIEVIPAEIGKHTQVKIQAVNPVQSNGVRGYFHDHITHLLVSHRGQDAVEFHYIRCSVLGFIVIVIDFISQSADPANFQAQASECRKDDQGGAGLSVCPCDAYESEA